MPRKPISEAKAAASFVSLFRESDKGCVLLMASWVETVLLNVLEAAMAVHLAKKQIPKDFFYGKLVGNNGPFSSFYNRTNLAYAFDLITYEQYQALELLRDLRNEAAHCIFEFKFDDPGITAHLKRLAKALPEITEHTLEKYRHFFPDKKDSVKVRFVLGCFLIFREIEARYFTEVERVLKRREELAKLKK